eukprot:351626-Chlamydomonas_euryale.AAC.4
MHIRVGECTKVKLICCGEASFLRKRRHHPQQCWLAGAPQNVRHCGMWRMWQRNEMSACQSRGVGFPVHVALAQHT